MIEFYKSNEWFRWVVFLPLVFLGGILLHVILLLTNLISLHSPFIHYVIFAIKGFGITYLLACLAPRFSKFFTMLYLCLNIFAVALGAYEETHGYGLEENELAFWVSSLIGCALANYIVFKKWGKAPISQ